YLQTDANEASEHGVRPDIVVHIRGKAHNLLIIEAKRGNSGSKQDKAKLVSATNENSALKYRFGVFCQDTQKGNLQLEFTWLQKGEKV
ncbi:MAG: hypothetical protein L3J82_05700, partial [Planctomycetes bacterium]|nr:hypothetical protein [Planctomycetota bacterium]